MSVWTLAGGEDLTGQTTGFVTCSHEAQLISLLAFKEFTLLRMRRQARREEPGLYYCEPRGGGGGCTRADENNG